MRLLAKVIKWYLSLNASGWSENFERRKWETLPQVYWWCLRNESWDE